MRNLFFQFIKVAIASCFVSSAAVVAKPYIGLDLGSSFSAHGHGILAGDEIGKWFRYELGTGYSKNGVAGLPLSGELRMSFSEGFSNMIIYFSAGLTYYNSSGKRRVVYEASPEHLEIESHAKWQFLYIRSSIGAWLPIVNDVFLIADTGFSTMAFASLKASPTGAPYDDTNIGRPLGLATGGDDQSYMGSGDFGPFLRVGVVYAFL